MKYIVLVLILTSAFCSGAVAEATTPACPACASVDKTSEAVAAPFTARSIYQLDANWTNDTGAEVKLSTLRGYPVVLAMFFAHCEYACPLIVGDMKRLRELLPPEIRGQTQFVLISFDSARDTTEALKAYRKRMDLGDSWTVMRGDEDAVQELAMVLGIKFKQDARGQFSHSNLITVLDGAGEVVRQRSGLAGDVSEIAKAVSLVAK